MDGGTPDLTRRKQSRHDGVLVVLGGANDFPQMIGGDASHVVVHGRQNGGGFFRDVTAREDHGRFGNAGQALGQQILRQVVQMQMNVILVWSHTSSFTNFNRHGTRHNVSRR